MKLIIGLAGEMGSGKGTIANYIKEKYKGNSYRFSNIIIKILDILHLEHIRKYTSGISTLLRKEYGDDIFSKIMARDAQEDKSEVVVIDGMRTLSDIKYFKNVPGFKLVFIKADIKSCFGRIKQRNENPDDETKTFEEFIEEHELETEIKIKDLEKYADFVIENNGTLEELYQKVDNILMKK